MKKINLKLPDFKKFDKKRIINISACVFSIIVLLTFAFLIIVPAIKTAIINSAKEELYKNIFTYPETGLITSVNGFDETDKNTLTYINAAMQQGADCIEVDVCFNEEGVPYIAEKPEDIQENTAPLSYVISLLSDEDDDETQKRHSLNIHLTDAANIEKIDEIVKSYDMLDYCFYTGVNINQAEYISSNSDIKFYIDFELEKSKINNADYASEVMNKITSLGGMGINCSADKFSSVMRDVFKENWLKISFYGADSELEIIEALAYSPNQLITENPTYAKQVLSEWNLNAPSNDILQYE